MVEQWYDNGTSIDYLVTCSSTDCMNDHMFIKTENWGDLLKRMRAFGWTNVKSTKSNKWLHLCPECSHKKNNSFKKVT